MIRIVVTGPESSGKTTLATQLSRHFNCPWIPEYARAFLMKQNGNYVREDLEIILEGQLKSWEKVKGMPLVIYDTDTSVLKIWHEFKYGTNNPVIDLAFSQQKTDLFLLCKPDISYEEDPLRENPNERDELFSLYENLLAPHKTKVRIIDGEGKIRLQKAIDAVAKIVQSPTSRD